LDSFRLIFTILITGFTTVFVAGLLGFLIGIKGVVLGIILVPILTLSFYYPYWGLVGFLIYMPFSGTITGATVAVTTAPVGSALTAGLLVGANSAATFSIAAAGTSAAGTLSGTATNLVFAAGDLVHLDVLTVGSSTAGSNITVAFTAVEG
jgi:hypothetical protein